MRTAALIFTVLLSTAVSAQAQEPTSGYAPVNGLKMYYEIHGSGSGELVLGANELRERKKREFGPCLHTVLAHAFPFVRRRILLTADVVVS